MNEYEYRDVTICLEDGIDITDEIKQMVEHYVDARFERPLLFYAQDQHHYMRFATNQEIQVFRLFAKPYEIVLRDDVGQVYFLDDLSVEDFSEEDQSTAKRFWYETVYVALAPNGTAWIDD